MSLLTDQKLQEYKSDIMMIGVEMETYGRFNSMLQFIINGKDDMESTPEQREKFQKAYDRVHDAMQLIARMTKWWAIHNNYSGSLWATHFSYFSVLIESQLPSKNSITTWNATSCRDLEKNNEHNNPIHHTSYEPRWRKIVFRRPLKSLERLHRGFRNTQPNGNELRRICIWNITR